MNFNFGEILSRAWQIVWKHRVLWIFGMLASCSRGGSNVNWNFNSSGGNGSFNGGTANLPPQFVQFLHFMAQNAASIIAITIAVVCVVWIVAIFIGTIGRIGLIRGTWMAENGENVAFGRLFSESMPYFWRIFGLSVLVGLPFLVVIGGMIASMVALILGASLSHGNNVTLVGFFALLPFFLICMCLLIPIGIVISLIVRQAERAIVLEGAGVLPALSRGWEIFRNNLGPIVVMAITLAVIGVVAGFVIAIPILIVVIPSTFAFVAGNIAGKGPNWNAMFAALACMCLLSPFLWLIRGVLVAYIESAWTLTYMRLTQPQDNAPMIIEANA
jgi:hypothetical protein